MEENVKSNETYLDKIKNKIKDIQNKISSPTKLEPIIYFDHLEDENDENEKNIKDINLSVIEQDNQETQPVNLLNQATNLLGSIVDNLNKKSDENEGVLLPREKESDDQIIQSKDPFKIEIIHKFNKEFSKNIQPRNKLLIVTPEMIYFYLQKNYQKNNFNFWVFYETIYDTIAQTTNCDCKKNNQIPFEIDFSQIKNKDKKIVHYFSLYELLKDYAEFEKLFLEKEYEESFKTVFFNELVKYINRTTVGNNDKTDEIVYFLDLIDLHKEFALQADFRFCLNNFINPQETKEIKPKVEPKKINKIDLVNAPIFYLEGGVFPVNFMNTEKVKKKFSPKKEEKKLLMQWEENKKKTDLERKKRETSKSKQVLLQPKEKYIDDLLKNESISPQELIKYSKWILIVEFIREKSTSLNIISFENAKERVTEKIKDFYGVEVNSVLKIGDDEIKIIAALNQALLENEKKYKNFLDCIAVFELFPEKKMSEWPEIIGNAFLYRSKSSLLATVIYEKEKYKQELKNNINVSAELYVFKEEVSVKDLFEKAQQDLAVEREKERQEKEERENKEREEEIKVEINKEREKLTKEFEEKFAEEKRQKEVEEEKRRVEREKEKKQWGQVLEKEKLKQENKGEEKKENGEWEQEWAKQKKNPERLERLKKDRQYKLCKEYKEKLKTEKAAITDQNSLESKKLDAKIKGVENLVQVINDCFENQLKVGKVNEELEKVLKEPVQEGSKVTLAKLISAHRDDGIPFLEALGFAFLVVASVFTLGLSLLFFLAPKPDCLKSKGEKLIENLKRVPEKSN